MVELVELRYPSPNGTSRDTAARFAGDALRALIERPGSPALRLDLTAMLDPGRAWIDELLNRRVVPYCRERGIPIAVLVGNRFAQEQLAKSIDPHARKLVDIQLVERNHAPTRATPRAHG